MPAQEKFSVDPMKELGGTGLRHSGGMVLEEQLRQLKGTKAVRIYEEMHENDPVIGAILFAIDKLIRQVSWTAKSADESAKAIEYRDFLQECMDDMSTSWVDVISEVMTMVPYGWSMQELVYKRRNGYVEGDAGGSSKFNDGRIGWRKWATRSQVTLDRWEFDPNGGINGMWQQLPYEPDRSVFLPIEKVLLFRTTVARGNPEGRSALRNAFRPWYFKKNMEEIEATGIERDLVGFPIMYVDPRITREDAADWEKALYQDFKDVIVNVRRDEQEGLVLPAVYDQSGNPMYRLELLSSGGGRTFDTNSIIQRYDQRIAMTVLADFILLGHERVGSFALSSDKTDLFAVAIGAWLDGIQGVINSHAVPRLWRLNGFDMELMPTIEHGEIESPPLADLITFISGLVSNGVPLFPNEDLQNWLLEIAGLPGRDEWEEAEPPVPMKSEQDEDAEIEAAMAELEDEDMIEGEANASEE